MPESIKVIDLFAGPGGLGEGFSASGPDKSPTFKIEVSVEMEPSAHKTLTLRAFTREFPNRSLPDEYYQYLRGNITKEEMIAIHPKEWAAAEQETLGRPVELGKDNELIHQSIENALGENDKPWVLIGGPPCQAYSLVGRARNQGIKDYVAEKDKRHYLYREYLEIIGEFQPAIFVMENVKGMLSAKLNGQPIFNQILQDLRDAGRNGKNYKIFSLSTETKEINEFGPIYKPTDFIVKAENYGVCQARHRVILLGVRDDFPVEAKDLLLQSKSSVVLKDLLANMPELRSGLSKSGDSIERWQQLALDALSEAFGILNSEEKKPTKLPESRGKKFHSRKNSFSVRLSSGLKNWLKDDKLGGVINHDTRGHMDLDIYRYAYVSLFGKTEGRSPKLKDFPEHLLPNHKNAKSGKFVDRFKVQLATGPAKTITSHISKDGHAFIHYDPNQCRSLTVREAARIQTFPENYFFEGNRTQQYVQVGNAVPPYLAYQIGLIVASIIR